MSQQGTVEVAGRVLGEILAPLAEELGSADRAQQLFAELGLNLPDEFFARPGFAARVSGGASAAAALPARVTALITAVEADDLGQIITTSAELFTEIARVVSAVDALATELGEGASALSGITATELRAFAGELPERLVHFLTVEWLDRHHRNALAFLNFFGLVEEIAERADVNDARRPTAVRRVLRLDRIADLVSDPLTTVAELYRWGEPDLDDLRLLEALRCVLVAIGRLAYLEPNGAGGLPEVRARDVHIRTRSDVSPPGVELLLLFELALSEELHAEIQPGLDVSARATAALATSTAVTIKPPFDVSIDPPATPVSGGLEVALTKSNPTAGQPLLLLGVAGGPRIEAGALRAALAVELAWNPTSGTADGEIVAEAALQNGKVVIALEQADGFLSAVLPSEGLALDIGLALGYSSTRGLYFRGAAGLEADLPVDLTLGPVRIPSIHLGLGMAEGGGLDLEASAAISARIGPFAMAIERMGVTSLVTFPGEGGNLHFANLALGFKPPSGIGLSLDAGIVKGGGYLYFDHEKGEYAGVLELAFAAFSIKAIGILSTKVPGEPGWALLLLVFGEFPPIQLGFGFSLNGVGGIVGLQHGVSVEGLQSGMRTGALDAVLFPDDPVANAPQIIGQLRVVFPITPRALTIGPVVALGWGTPAIIEVRLGILLQIDNVLGAGEGDVEISRVVLVGQLEVHVPPLQDLGDDVPELIKLLVDIVGAYETREKQLSIDARLRDSSVATLPLTGSLVVRANFGDRPSFLLAAGGFHPRFTDIPAGVPPQDRLGIEMRYSILVCRLQGYLAITSNTFQVGAEVSILASGGGFRAEAYLGFDALFVFEPNFHFEIDFRVGASISYKGINFASADLRGSLSGPGRWHVVGTARLKLLLFSVSVGFDESWGDAPALPQPDVAVGAQLAAAYADPANWTAQLPAGGDSLVTLRRVEGESAVLAHPLGEVAVSQKVVPLKLEITHVGSGRPSDGTRFDVTEVTIGSRQVTPAFHNEHFARAQYLDLTEEEKLSTPSFEQFPAGVAVSTSAYAASASQMTFAPEFETVYLTDDTRVRSKLPRDLLLKHARFGAAAQSLLRRKDVLVGDSGLKVDVDDVRYAVSGIDKLAVAVALGDEAASSFSLASQAAFEHGDHVQVVEAAELVGLT